VVLVLGLELLAVGQLVVYPIELQTRLVLLARVELAQMLRHLQRLAKMLNMVVLVVEQ
jgi:hypothetical protein